MSLYISMEVFKTKLGPLVIQMVIQMDKESFYQSYRFVTCMSTTK